MYVGPFVAAWEKIVDIRSILREGAFMFGKKIAILLSTAMILTGPVYLLWLYMHRLVMRLNMHRKHRQQVCRALQSLLRRLLWKQSCLPVVLQWKPADTGKRGG
mgnify:CR=1 FL=1